MRLKEGVSPRGTRSEVLLALVIAAHSFEMRGFECVVTSLNDGKHRVGSKHYDGSAVDLRIKHLPPSVASMISGEIDKNLGKEFDVILEGDHIHIEYHPKGPDN